MSVSFWVTIRSRRIHRIWEPASSADLEGVPGQGGALDPDRDLTHPGERLELAEVRILVATVFGTGHHLVEVVEEGADLVNGLALDGFGHQRGGGGGNGAAGALEGNVLHLTARRSRERR